MNNESSEIADILLHSEDKNSGGEFPLWTYKWNADTYREAKSPFFRQMLPVKTEPVKYKTAGEEIFVISDLHIASGRNFAGVYKGTENFFADDSFSRFLNYAHTIKKTESAILIINGDIFDFLRITEYPGKVRKVRWSKRIKQFFKFDPIPESGKIHRKIVEDEFLEWKDELEKLGIKKTMQELEASISEKEKTYGLKTDDYKTVYKLVKTKHGHPEFFNSLSLWLERGNKIIITKGNHDLELYWLTVRNYLRLILAENIAWRRRKKITDALKNDIIPNVTFFDDSVEIDGDFYVEHGHRYDKFTMVLGSPILKKVPDQINIPFGSFFNRYLINRIELYFPFFDNVRPSGNILPILIKQNFPLAVKIYFQYIPFVLRVLFTNFRYVWFMVHRVAGFLVALLIPVAFILFYYIIPSGINITAPFGQPNKSGIFNTIIEQLKPTGALILSYFTARLVAWFQLTEPNCLDKYAKTRFQGTCYRIITMGHTHNPGEYVFEGDKKFYNTGTWIPVIETSTAEVRVDKTYTFLHLTRDEEGKLQPADGLLQRWDDEAGRAEPQILNERK